MKIFARIREDSKYSDQNDYPDYGSHFPVQLQETRDNYIWQGGIGGQYRTSDLDFFIRDHKGELISYSIINSDRGDLLIQRCCDDSSDECGSEWCQTMIDILQKNIDRFENIKKKAIIREREIEEQEREERRSYY